MKIRKLLAATGVVVALTPAALAAVIMAVHPKDASVLKAIQEAVGTELAAGVQVAAAERLLGEGAGFLAAQVGCVPQVPGSDASSAGAVGCGGRLNPRYTGHVRSG